METKELQGLWEAYNAVYAPQELTEEQVWEEVKNWVNDLVEEGYDLSDYTWEEMYKSYIEEQGAFQGSLFTTRGKPQNFRGKPGGKPRTPFIKTEPVPTRSRVRPKPPRIPASIARQSPGQLSIPPARSQEFIDTQRLNRTTGGGLMGTTRPTNLPSRAPKPAWEKPALGPAPKPTTTKPTPTSTTKPTTKLPGANRVGQIAGFLGGLTRITPASVAAAVSAPRPTASGTLTAALKRGDYKPQQGPKNPDQGLTKAQSFDRAYAKAKKTSGMGSTFTWNNKSYKVEGYDALFSYVLDEGYADNEEAATNIVENMSENWIYTILEAHPVYDKEFQNYINTGTPYIERSPLRPRTRTRKKKSISR